MRVLCKIEKKIKEYQFRRNWKKKNLHNYSYAVGREFPLDKVHVGRYTYGPMHVVSFPGCECTLDIGDFCSVAENTTFVLGGEHSLRCVSTYPFRRWFLNEYVEAFSKGNIVIGNDVWIGYGATILSGTCIGQGAVIAAGAVVTGNVEPYAIYGGVPAKLIKYRFEPEIREQLMKIDFTAISKENYQDIKKILEINVTRESVVEIVSCITQQKR